MVIFHSFSGEVDPMELLTYGAEGPRGAAKTDSAMLANAIGFLERNRSGGGMARAPIEPLIPLLAMWMKNG